MIFTLQRIVLSLAILAGLSASVQSAQPIVSIVNPPGLQRGTSTEISLIGARLGDAKQLVFFTPGIEATSFTAVDDNHVRVTVQASPEAASMLHAFRVITSTGISNLRYMSVSPFPTVTEAEPNNDFAAPQLVSIGSTINGVVLNEDIDHYAIDVSKGTTISVEIEGLRHAFMENFFDPFVAILDSKRFELARSDDSALLQQDGVCSAVAPEDGRYIIEVRESSFVGSDRCLYRLHIGNYSRPLSIVPGGGAPSSQLEATLVDALGNSWKETFQLPASRNDRFPVWSTKNGQQLPSPNLLRVNNYTNVLEVEPNADYNTQAVNSTFPMAFNGVLETKGDRDWFLISAKKDQTIEMRLYGRTTLRSPIDAVVEIVKQNGPYISGADDTGGPDSFVTFKAPEDANYAISVRDHLGSGGPDYAYRLEVEAQSPAIDVTINEQERYVSQTVEVPRGARMAFEANLVRKAVGGEGRIVLQDLPPGMSQSDGVVPGDLGSIPILIRAAADSANLGKLVDIQGSIAIDATTNVVGHLAQRSQLIRGANNVDVWGYTSDRLAVAITDPAPFDIEVVQPAVPIVRDGTMPLKVRAKRKEGFTNPINVNLLYFPPGISAPGSNAIAGDQSEVDIPITANGGAAIRKWPITVIATADTGRGAIRIASEFVMVEVADRLFDFQFAKTMVEQGKPGGISIGVKLNRPASGNVEVELLGTPPGVTIGAPKIALAQGVERLDYPIQIAADARAGSHKTMVARGTVTSPEGVITQVNGTIELQIDIPLPAAPAPAAPVPEVAMAAATPPPAQPVEKPLTRLEQLRKQREGK